MPIPNTERKLREARYFARSLSERAQQSVGDPEEILYLLSAFLSAARSVTFVLQAEAKDAHEAWFAAWQASLPENERQMFRQMNEERVAEVHRKGAGIVTEMRFVPITELRNEGRSAHYGVTWFGPPGVPPPSLGRVEQFFDFGDGPAPVARTCVRHCELLERAIADFRCANCC